MVLLCVRPSFQPWTRLIDFHGLVRLLVHWRAPNDAPVISYCKKYKYGGHAKCCGGTDTSGANFYIRNISTYCNRPQ